MAFTGQLGTADSGPGNLQPGIRGGTIQPTSWWPQIDGWPLSRTLLTRSLPALMFVFGPVNPLAQPPAVVVEGMGGPSLADVRYARCPSAWVLDPLPLPRADPPDGAPWTPNYPDRPLPVVGWIEVLGRTMTGVVEPITPPAEAAELGWTPQLPPGVWLVGSGRRPTWGVSDGALADPVTIVEPLVWEPLLPSVPPAPRPLRRVSAGETAFLEPVINISRMAWWSVVIGVPRPRRTVWEGAAGGTVLRPPSLGFGASTDVVYLGHEFVASPALAAEYLGD